MTTQETSLVPENEWRSGPDYQQAMEYMQKACWPEAVAALEQLHDAHPEDLALQRSLADARLRLEAEQTQRVDARRFHLPGRRVVFAVVLAAVLIALGVVARGVYAGVVVPSLDNARAAKEVEGVANQAAQALAAGDYQRALDTYQELASIDPNHPALADGMAHAKAGLELDADYKAALQQLADGKLAEAQATLVKIQQTAPNYRNVRSLLADIERQQRLAGLLRKATDAQKAGDLEAAVAALQEARSLTPAQDRDAIDSDLFEAYLALATNVIKRSQAQPAELERARVILGQALAIRPQESRAKGELDSLERYLAGYQAFSAGQWVECVTQLEPLYAEKPTYLDGKAARTLYDAYLRAGDAALQAGDSGATVNAWDYYTRASQIQGVDATAAKALVSRLTNQITPTPAPKPTRSPAATPVPAAVKAAPPPVSQQAGKILYWSNRGSASELWSMDADGQNAARVEDQAKAKAEYDRNRQSEQRSPDGASGVTVAQAGGQGLAQIFVTNGDGSVLQLTRFEGASYDPVWSPAGHWIAFVTNAMGNDEIYIVGADGQNAKRLTNNAWEWDKHPSWSPDGKRIVFWSNREVGHGQIWIMNADGSGQTNLSKSQYDERDPVWIK
jgi:tetratricopeptide (TPR) repeat protein